ncbi:DUF3987 domain-containing protein [Pseudooceanicola sp.]|uniref:DUF3987 domain-containing protein n=1 Tax=Pseudooceanicola sp. TaxID=1914328 RepID=UPI00262C567E|nr:DUF3987 domain-containing protein [Pseudooceanicola sp.]MDF1855060.1 DUF3987 domain-containing protein [Pseudooceanicola sp.]
MIQSGDGHATLFGRRLAVHLMVQPAVARAFMADRMAAEQAARIAGVLALWRDLDAPAVTAQDMGNGIALAQFYLSEAVRMADAATVSQEIDRAEALRHWLLASWPHSEVMARDVVRLGPNPLRESPKARAALGILERHGWLAPLDHGTVVRGAARAEVWRIVKGGGDVV